MKRLFNHLWGNYLKPFLWEARKTGVTATRKAEVGVEVEAEAEAKPKQKYQRRMRTVTLLIEMPVDTMLIRYRFNVDLASDGVWLRGFDEGVLAGRARAKIYPEHHVRPACFVSAVGDEVSELTLPASPSRRGSK